ncbi:MAG: ABC transporter permease [Acidobacteriota bacterium]
MFERFKHMLIKEFIHVLRDPRMKAVIIMMPIIQALVFGYAVTTDVTRIPTAVYDLDNSPASREIARRFGGSGYFMIAEYVDSDGRAQELIDRGKVKAVMRVNRGFGETLAKGRTAPMQIILDGSDSNTAGIVLKYATTIVGQYSEQVLLERLQRSTGAVPASGRIDLATRAWFNENLESRYFYVPGVIALLVMLVTLLLSSMAVVREKEVGTIEQIIVTPITKTEFILGKTLPFAIIGFLDVVLITVIALYWFQVPLRGSLWLLLAATGLYLMSTLGAGLLISTVSRTQQQAMMSTFFYYFPAVLLSGFMFPISNMPQVVQWLTLINPLRYFLVIIRGIFLKGVGPSVLWTQMAALAILGSVMLVLAITRFKKTLA